MLENKVLEMMPSNSLQRTVQAVESDGLYLDCMTEVKGGPNSKIDYNSERKIEAMVSFRGHLDKLYTPWYSCGEN